MTDPTDAELLEFVARFAGWRDFDHGPGKQVWGFTDNTGPSQWLQVPDYLHSVDAWLRDVWPKIEAIPMLDCIWLANLELIITHGPIRHVNADARFRCLALWRALEGKLP